jgi:hypothetical protein
VVIAEVVAVDAVVIVAIAATVAIAGTAGNLPLQSPSL